ATPALSGTRSPISASIAARCSPSACSISGDLANSPTMPHICPYRTPSGSGRSARIGRFSAPVGGDFLHVSLEARQILADFPRRDRFVVAAPLVSLDLDVVVDV